MTDAGEAQRYSSLIMDPGNTTPLVSVVIPAFNAEKFVDRAIESVLSQSYSNFELVVVDDGSTDNTAEIAASFVDPRIRNISQPNRGVAAARNRGMAMSAGELIAFLDADDRWDPEKLKAQVNALATKPGCVAIGCFMRYESLDGKVLGITGQEVGPREEELIAEGSLMPFPLSSIVFDRPALERISGFDEGLRLAQDLDLVARVSGIGAISGLTECLGAYVIHSESASATNLKAQRMATRFVRERLRRRAQGGDLTWDAFQTTYKTTWTQAYGDMVQARYRRTGELFAQGKWGQGTASGALSVVLGPRNTFRRYRRQRQTDFQNR